MPDLELTTKPTKDKNQPDADFDMETFECKENAKTIFGRRNNTKEGNKENFLIFTDQ